MVYFGYFGQSRKTAMKKYLLSLFFLGITLTSIILASGNLLKGFIPTQNSYVCPPCGCAYDHLILTMPGQCRSCKMPLIQEKKGQLCVAANLVAPAFQMGPKMNLWFHKFIFPSFLMALFVALLNWRQHRNRSSAVYLSLFLLGLATFAFKNQFYGTPYALNLSRRFLYFPLSLLLISAPALFFYIKSLQGPPFLSNKKTMLHFLPAGVFFSIQILLFLGPENWRQALLYNHFDHYIGLAEQGVFLLLSTVYLRASLKIIRNFPEEIAKKHPVLLLKTWMSILLIWGLLSFANFVLYNMMATIIDYHPLWIALALFFYWTSYLIAFKKDKILPIHLNKTNRVSTHFLGKHVGRLNALMANHKPHLNPNLKLSQLAELVELSDKDLSEVLNRGYKMGLL